MLSPVFPATHCSVALMLPALTALPATTKEYKWPLNQKLPLLREPMNSG